MSVPVQEESRYDQNEVDTQLGQIKDCEDSAERMRLFSEMKSKLLPHLQAEQEGAIPAPAKRKI
jgi:hypothetical protein